MSDFNAKMQKNRFPLSYTAVGDYSAPTDP